MDKEESISPVVETQQSTSPEMMPSKKGGNKKPLIITLCVLGVAVLGVACFFGYKMLFGKKDPVKQTSGAIRGLKSGIKDVKKNNDEIVSIMDGNDPYEVTATIKTDFPRELGIDNFNFKVLAQSDEKKGQTKLDLTAKYGFQNIMDLSAILDKEVLYFKLNDTMSKYYKMAMDSEDLTVNVDASKLEMLGDYDVTKIIDYLADSIDSNVKSTDFAKEKAELTINQKEVKATKYTASLSEKKLKGILDGFLKKVSNDKELVKIIAEVQNVSEKDIKEAINEFVKDSSDYSNDKLFDYSIYLTSSGDALGYSVTVEGTEYLVAVKDETVSLQAVVNGVSVALEFTQESDDHFVISLNSMGMELGKIDIKSKLETITKGKEYRKTIDIVLNAPTVLKKDASMKIVLDVKKIDSVNVSGTSDAIDVENMTEAEASIFESQLERSSLYKFFNSYAGGHSTTNYGSTDFDSLLSSY